MTEADLAERERLNRRMRELGYGDDELFSVSLKDLEVLVAEVRRLQALVPPLGSIVVTNPCDRCLHDRVTHLDSGSMVCESPCDCPGFVPRGVEEPE